jgi:ParB/RepB/Spo0J family partition protein
VNRLITELIISDRNPRTITQDQDLEKLRDSIARLGVLEPLLIKPSGEILAGHRRFAAAQSAGLTEIPVIVMECENDQRSDEIILAENVHRKDLTHSEIGVVLKHMSDDGLSLRKIASITQFPSSQLKSYLTISRLTSEIQMLIDLRQIPLGASDKLKDVSSELQRQLAARITKPISVNRLARMIDELRATPLVDSDTRQQDCAWTIDQCVKLAKALERYSKLKLYARLERHADLNHIEPFVSKIQHRLQSISRDVLALTNELVTLQGKPERR